MILSAQTAQGAMTVFKMTYDFFASFICQLYLSTLFANSHSNTRCPSILRDRMSAAAMGG